VARLTGWDPLLVRFGAILAVLALGPLAILLYVLAAWLAD
jgi:phage shock protein PspC (stress-responsive transcriptional regulator)